MGLWIATQIRKLIKAFTSGQTPSQIAFGFCLGSLLGWTPKNLFLAMLILLLLIVLNVNLGIGILAWVLIGFGAFLIDPFAHEIGLFLLELNMLEPLWIRLSELPILPYSNFNNTVMLGSLVIAILAFLPTFIIIKALVSAYRKHLHPKLEKLWIVKLLKASKVVTFFQGKAS